MWKNPKTNWNARVNEEGQYIGDRFNAEDFNRIKNNLEYLRSFAGTMYEQFGISSSGEDRTFRDLLYADEINLMEENLKTINTKTVRQNYGVAPVYVENGNTMDYMELNRLESAILDIYNRLNNQFEGRRMFTWNFGIKGVML